MNLWKQLSREFVAWRWASSRASLSRLLTTFAACLLIGLPASIVAPFYLPASFVLQSEEEEEQSRGHAAPCQLWRAAGRGRLRYSLSHLRVDSESPPTRGRAFPHPSDRNSSPFRPVSGEGAGAFMRC